MDDSSASTSADPLTLPSSPLVRHSSPRKASTKPVRTRSPNKQTFSSPSKSFIMDTGDGGPEQSPWRIKVTVQAEPREGSSPGKKPATKTTTVPLKGGSSSPAKRPARRKKLAQAEESEMDVEVKRPQRKRKGTPMRKAPRRPTPAKVAEIEATEAAAEDGSDVAVASSPTKKPVWKGGRKSFGVIPTQRGQRLSQAREELDEALWDAVGEEGDCGHHDEEMPMSEAMQGEMTAMNEDFTMISVETLESMKQNTSMLEDSQIGDKSAVNGSYWPSSPPANPESAKRNTKKQESASKVAYPNISAQAQFARDTPAKAFSEAFDAMSWKPASRHAQEPTPADSSELQHSSGKKQPQATEPEEWQKERKVVSQQIEDAPQEDIVVVDDEPEAELGAEESNDEQDDRDDEGDVGGDDDIWAEEASRSLEEDVDSSHLSRRSNRQPQHHNKSNTAENINGLFSGLSSKPPRAKIPRTWRRSSGTDFQYSDFPAHSFAQEDQDHQDRKDTGTSGSDDEAGEADRGSGVLTPPSSDEDEPDEDEEMQDVEQDEPENGASKSVFEPDAAATELQLQRENDAETDAESNDEPSTAEGDDTGLFWRNKYHGKHKPPVRPRVPLQRKAQDLSALLKEEESSQLSNKPSPQASQPEPTQPAQAPRRFPGSRLLAARREAASSSFTSTSSGESLQHHASLTRGNETDNSLRKSILKNSKPAMMNTGDKVATAGASEDTRQAGSLDIPDTSAGNTSFSFSSKTSDQQQLLSEHSRPLDLDRILGRKLPSALERSRSITDLAIEVGRKERERAAQAAKKGVEREGDSAPVSSPAQSADYSFSSPAKDTNDDESESEVEEDEEEHEDDDEEAVDEINASQRSVHDTTRSYEEHLNVSSPQKVRVNFGDSSTATAGGSSSLLAPKQKYPSLFTEPERPVSRGRQYQTEYGRERPAIARSQPPSQPGFFSKLSTTIWSAFAGTSTIPTVEPVFPASLSAQIRSRYGVLSNQHSFTMAHIRTLHRMLNSCTSQRIDSIVPKPGTMDLPSSLLPFKGKKMKDTVGRPFTCTEQHCLVAWCFAQTLVEPSFVSQIENGEIDFIGDKMALELRGYWDEYEGLLRHGRDPVFTEQEVVKPKPKDGGLIGMEWVVRCLGACVWAQKGLEEREARIKAERRRWEARNGIVDAEESEVLPKVGRA